jgi:hypothetical protein
MTHDVSDDPADYLIGICILAGLAVLVLVPAAWFIATGSGYAFFLTLFFGKFAGWIVCAPDAPDEDE